MIGKAKTAHPWFVFGALFASADWYEAYIEHSQKRKKFALYCKTRALLVHDRALSELTDDASVLQKRPKKNENLSV